MKVLHINTFGNGSTGRIAADICRTLHENGHEGLVAFSRNRIDNDVPHYQFGSKWSVYTDGGLTRVTDRAGFYSSGPTKNLIKKIKEYDPDIIHLHNLHGYYINIELLFNYLKESGKPVVWTLHDCWPLTGHCPYFDFVGCDKWKTGCHNCPQIHEYPKSLVVDNSAQNYQKKKKLFTSLPDLHLVCVSHWLETIVKQSFLGQFPVSVIYNGIDCNVFKPINESNYRDQYGLKDKFIILGVASDWSPRKGLNDFIRLSEKLSSDYQIVLVGLNKTQIKTIPEKIIGLPKTKTINELAEIYSTADIYFNASVEETFGMTTLESLACNTPVIVYNSTALPEICKPGTGFVVNKRDVNEVSKILLKIEEIREIKETNFSQNIAKNFNLDTIFKNYIELYENIIMSKNFANKYNY